MGLVAMHRFFVQDVESKTRVELPEQEAHHLAHVLRLGPGATIVLFDGSGTEYTARVASVQRRGPVVVEIVERRDVCRELPFEAAGLPRTGRRKVPVAGGEGDRIGRLHTRSADQCPKYAAK